MAPEIKITVTTDDHAYSFSFDGKRWFWQAREEELSRIELEEFSADYTVDQIYYYFQDEHKELKQISNYLDAIKDIPGREDYSGFLVEVDEKNYYDWLNWIKEEYELQSGNIIRDNTIIDGNGHNISKYSLEVLRNYLELI